MILLYFSSSLNFSPGKTWRYGTNSRKQFDGISVISHSKLFLKNAQKVIFKTLITSRIIPRKCGEKYGKDFQQYWEDIFFQYIFLKKSLACTPTFRRAFFKNLNSLFLTNLVGNMPLGATFCSTARQNSKILQ